MYVYVCVCVCLCSRVESVYMCVVCSGGESVCVFGCIKGESVCECMYVCVLSAVNNFFLGGKLVQLL